MNSYTTALINGVNESIENFYKIFHQQQKNYEDILSIIQDAEKLFNGIGRTNFAEFKDVVVSEFKDNDKRLIANFIYTFYNFLDYFDIEYNPLNKDLIKKFNGYLDQAEKKAADAPEVSAAFFRLTLCAPGIYYRLQQFEDGMKSIARIETVIKRMLPDFVEKKLSPSVLGDLYFLKAKLLVRNNLFDDADSLFIKSVKKYEEWEVWKNVRYKEAKEQNSGQDSSTGNLSDSSIENGSFRDFITYKIALAQAFSLYSNVLQGKIDTVVRESSTIERLLEYTKHRNLKFFVQMLRAKALRLGGYRNPNQLKNAIFLVRKSQEVFQDCFKKSQLGDAEFVTLRKSEITLYNNQRLYLMSLFQVGLAYFYLLESDPETEWDKHSGRLNETIQTLHSENKNNYWTIRANLLSIYYCLLTDKLDEAFDLAEESLEINCPNKVLRLEALTASAEVGVNYLMRLKRKNTDVFNDVHAGERVRHIISETRRSLRLCGEIERTSAEAALPNTEKKSTILPKKSFALYYLLQCEMSILEEKIETAEIYWRKWMDVAGHIEFSRWRLLADSIKQRLENLETKFVYDAGKSYDVNKAIEALELWLYKKVAQKFPSKTRRIQALGISPEKYYKWEKQFDHLLTKEKPLKRRGSSSRRRNKYSHKK